MRPTLSDENGFEKEQNSLAGTKRIDLCNGGESPLINLIRLTCRTLKWCLSARGTTYHQ